ncbi:hypothetical protein NT2_13_00370 [Caenibius tardaugens NBRC 16725]|uniref:Putative Flp pilus-assembly TadG-like N-terminal domain-containing protein n=1 Tax=Caenibius tardaugens NBRC 16725 TaxID=1219035 RepID=U2YPU4_9SPHN|nr:TadE/TadG family type IV pilus assembly protein [Caenibius tardaugens]AZI37917.1 hypothetical protein EGO55_19730 [Caenibius tardaugens NBRC 16725]GAD50950.1 hypothetical protein NT2_13_00370 [Caenibius tardaugens NBRC 16725]
MRHRDACWQGLFARLLRDRAGNTLAIVAAALVPMMAIIGGGVDVSRAYMAKTELQAACDAGVLAGRRAMAKSGEYGTSERAKADSMFNFNFNGASVSASNISFETDDNDEGQVTGAAEADVPTAVMYVFGKDQFALSVNCMAELQLANVDVMFVLDSTGSMNCAPTGNCPSTSVEQPGSKISSLRAAVRDFHKTVAEAVLEEETRVRYAFVPYSTTVNATELITTGALPTTAFTESTRYQTRVGKFDKTNEKKVEVSRTSTTTTNENVTSSYNTKSKCNNATGGTSTATDNSNTDPSGQIWEATTITKYAWDSNASKCTKTIDKYTIKYDRVYYFQKWVYRQELVNTSAYRTRAAVRIATSLSPYKVNSNSTISGSYIAKRDINASGEYNVEQLGKMPIPDMATSDISKSSWNGCIEERDTVRTNSFDPVPANAFDLDINGDADSDATRWHPIWPGLSYFRSANVTSSDSGTASSNSCPAVMKQFQTIDLKVANKTEVPDWLADYLDNKLVAVGNTYHDIGMIWGGRLGSPNGIFEENVNADDPRNVSRHLIFLTDGKMEPNRERYTAYGVEISDNRIGAVNASNTTLADIHTKRFLAACRAAENAGYVVYVVTFATELTDDLKKCATSGRHYEAGNTTELRNAFKFIASQVADLRLGA